MRTTLNLDDHLVKRAKRRALDLGTTLSKVIEQALARELTEPREPAVPFSLHVFADAPAAPVDIADRDALYARMEDDPTRSKAGDTDSK